MSENNPLLQAARQYTGLGLACIPLAPKQKLPTLKNWQSAGIADEMRLLAFFGNPSRNIGIVCGLNSHNLVVVDWDELPAWQEWRARNPGLPGTMIVRGRRGVHEYWRVRELPAHKFKLYGPDGEPIADVLTTGAQVVAPPSVHPTGVQYVHIGEMSIAGVETLEHLNLPAHNPKRAQPPRTTRDPVNPTRSPEGRALEALREFVGAQAEGNRNNALFWASCRAFDYGLTLAQVENLLLKPAMSIGLTEDESVATIGSAKGQTRREVASSAPAPAPSAQRKPQTAQQRAERRLRARLQGVRVR